MSERMRSGGEMTLAEAFEFLEILHSQCADPSIAAADLIEWSERDEAMVALSVALNLLRPMLSATRCAKVGHEFGPISPEGAATCVCCGAEYDDR